MKKDLYVSSVFHSAEDTAWHFAAGIGGQAVMTAAVVTGRWALGEIAGLPVVTELCVRPGRPAFGGKPVPTYICAG